MQHKQEHLLILGGTGKVGRALSKVWPVEGPVPVWQAREGGGYPWDMLAAPAPDLPENTVGVVVLAGVTQGDAATLSANTDLARVACDLAARAGGLRVLIASSQAVYGAPTAPASEQTPAVPTTPYGHAKLMMERAVADAPNTTCLRIGNVAGCDGLFGAMARGGTLSLDQFANGQGPRRAYIGPKVLADTLCALIRHPAPLPKVLNVAQSGSVQMEAVLDAAAVSWQWVPERAGALPALDLNCDELAKLVSISAASASDIVAQARAAGWSEGDVA